ncbi:20770_t:CDS:2 [Gigaspora rosea]|nr:20770_t:CDS:2 [Gigaspora rosea]
MVIEGTTSDSSTSNAASTSPESVVFAVLCTAAIALVITAAALFFVTRRQMKTDDSLDPENALKRKDSLDSGIIFINKNSGSMPILSPSIPIDQPTKEKPSTPPSTGSATPQIPQLNTQAPFYISHDFFNTPPKAHKSGTISRSRSSLDLHRGKEKEDLFSETTPFNDSPGPPLGSVHHVPRIDSEQLVESPYMTSHHHSTDYLQEMPSPMRPEYSTTSPVRSPRTSGDVRPQSRQSSEYLMHSPQEFQDPQLHSAYDEPTIYPEGSPANIVDPYLEPTTTRSERSERSERSRSRGRSTSPYIHRHASSPYEPTEFDDADISDQPHPTYTPEDNAGAPLTTTPSLTRRARSSRRPGRERRGGGNTSGTT